MELKVIEVRFLSDIHLQLKRQIGFILSELALMNLPTHPITSPGALRTSGTWRIKLREHYGDSLTIDTLFNERVTRENVIALKRHLKALTEDDKVIVSYSGHGVLSTEYDYFLSTYPISFEKPEERGLPYDDLESLLDGIRPRKKLMLIDACHSGELDKEEIAKIELSKLKLDSSGVTHKSEITIVPKKSVGMANSFELMQSLFVNVGKGTGATIISAAGGMQYAQERGDLEERSVYLQYSGGLQ